MPEIIVDFVPDYSKLEDGITKLTNSGVIGKEIGNLFKGAQKPIDDFAKKVGISGKVINKDLSLVKKQVEGISKSMADGFREGVAQALDEAGVSVEEFEEKLKQVIGTEKTLKQQLKETKEALAQMKLEGKENTEQYEQLIQKAGQLADTLSDVAAETRRVGSDTRRIDTVIEVVQGLGAAYQIAQSAAALLGSENEDLQKGLLRLQAIMGITMGIQQIANLLQKESNAIRFITNLQLKAQTAATNLQTAAQSRNVVVSFLATNAMRVLNTVMKANPAFLLVSAFAALAGALAFFSGRSKTAKDITEDLTAAIQAQDRALTDLNDTLQFNSDIRIEQLKQQGADEKTIFAEQLKLKKDQLKNLENEESSSQLRLQIFEQQRRERAAATQGKISKKEREQVKNQTKIIEDDLRARGEAVLKTKREIDMMQAEFTTGQVERDKAAADKAAQDAEKAAQKIRDIEAQKLQDIKTRIETQLTAVNEGGKKQLDLQIALADAEKNIGLFNAKSIAEKEFAIAKFLSNVDKLATDFYANDQRKALQAQAATINAQLQNINLEFSERERLTIELLDRQRGLELLEVAGNKEKEKEVNAKFDREIAQQRLEIKKQALEDELRLATADGGVRKRALQVVADDEKAFIEIRKQAIDDLADIEIDAIERKGIANTAYYEAGLISEQEFNAVAAELKDEAAVVHENTEKRKTEITEAEINKRKEFLKQELLEVLDAAARIADTLGNITSVISARAQSQIDLQRQQLEDLREGGSITEREFIERSRRLDIADRNAKRKAAEREKAIQLFQAFIAGARAIIEAAPDPFKIAFTALLVGAQIAAIAARPIPKFGKGVKAAPKGFAEVGETGTELIQMPGTDKYFVADHPQVIWLKGGERIYNPRETDTILKSQTPAADRSLTDSVAINGGSSLAINEASLAKKIGEEIAKHPRNVFSIDEDGFTHHVQQNLYEAHYRNKQYTFHD